MKSRLMMDTTRFRLGTNYPLKKICFLKNAISYILQGFNTYKFCPVKELVNNIYRDDQTNIFIYGVAATITKNRKCLNYLMHKKV